MPDPHPPIELLHLEEDGQLRTAFPVMRELRPQLPDAATFIARVRRQAHQGYRLLGAWCDGQVLALAGYRELENLIHGRFIYVDDLVADPQHRSRGLGARLLEELALIGGGLGCQRLVLDTALANSLAQRFYFRQGLLSTGLHFSRPLPVAAPHPSQEN